MAHSPRFSTLHGRVIVSPTWTRCILPLVLILGVGIVGWAEAAAGTESEEEGNRRRDRDEGGSGGGGSAGQEEPVGEDKKRDAFNTPDLVVDCFHPSLPL